MEEMEAKLSMSKLI